MKHTIVLRPGRFTADDILATAVAVLWLATKNMTYEIVRTNSPSVCERAQIVLGTGGQYEVTENRWLLDHHCEPNAGKRLNGVPYATAGLAWRHFGGDICERLCSKADAVAIAAQIDRQCLHQNDVIRVERRPLESTPEPLRQLLNFNRCWDEPLGKTDARTLAEIESRNFESAVAFGETYLVNTIRLLRSELRAEQAVQAAYFECGLDNHVMILPQQLPWEAPLLKFDRSDKIWYIIWPDPLRELYVVEGVRRGFSYCVAPRNPLPAEWSTLSPAALEQTTGVTDIHLMDAESLTCTSLESAVRLADLAVEVKRKTKQSDVTNLLVGT